MDNSLQIVATHTRKKKTYLLQDKLPDNVEIEVIEHKLKEVDLLLPENAPAECSVNFKK